MSPTRSDPTTRGTRTDAAASGSGEPAVLVVPRRRRRRDVGAAFGAAWLAVMVLAALLAGVLPLIPPETIGQDYSLAPLQSLGHVLGTDQLGRDQLSWVVFGARVSLSVAIGATLIGLVLGTAGGMLAGYYRGAADTAFDILTNAILAFPPLIFLIALVAALQPSIGSLTVGLAMIAVPTFARIARANTIAFADREFVTAARAMGASDVRILSREVLPNVLLPLMSFALVVAAALVVAEGSLSFLGLGVPPPAPSWGGMIAAGREELYSAPHLVLIPGLFFFLTVFSLNRVGDWARGRVGRESSL